jgi:hypothetical protein
MPFIFNPKDHEITIEDYGALENYMHHLGRINTKTLGFEEKITYKFTWTVSKGELGYPKILCKLKYYVGREFRNKYFSFGIEDARAFWEQLDNDGATLC